MRRLAAMIAILGTAGCLAVPVSAPAAHLATTPAMSLVFASGTAHSIADNLAVPVECVGSGHGFCSGVVALSRNGHRISIPFSVRAGGHDLLFVPLRLGLRGGHPRKVHGVATTVQPLGPPTSSREFLFAR